MIATPVAEFRIAEYFRGRVIDGPRFTRAQIIQLCICVKGKYIWLGCSYLFVIRHARSQSIRVPIEAKVHRDHWPAVSAGGKSCPAGQD